MVFTGALLRGFCLGADGSLSTSVAPGEFYMSVTAIRYNVYEFQVPTRLKIRLLSYYWCSINTSEHIAASTQESSHHRHRHARCPKNQLLANLNNIICDLQSDSTCEEIQCNAQQESLTTEDTHVRTYHNLLLSLKSYIHCEMVTSS